MIKFLPSYVGSKAYWVGKLDFIEGRNIIELFCGSAVISANYAKKCVLNDNDIYIYNILKYFDKQIINGNFTIKDYYRVRKQQNWWRHVYNLQKMSFSGVFRYSKNGYNVPPKKNKEFINTVNQYEDALDRWKYLKPKIYNKSYLDINLNHFKNPVVVLDPPYQNSQAAYNNNKFDYDEYWEYVYFILGVYDILIFDTEQNLLSMDFPILGRRKMRVNGKRKGNIEAFSYVEKF